MFKSAFSSFSVDNLEDAKKFYGETLGLEVSEDKEMGMLEINLAGGGKVMVYPKGPGHTPATYTVLNFPVENIDEAVDQLKEKGVEFEHYDDVYIKTDEKGIARGRNENEPKGIAWFKDPAGNILAVLESK